MGSLSDLIEQYLREQLNKMETIEVKRRELARMFRCVPSQINYVLETRFTMNHGYMVHSRRGGGGFIRITRINWKQGKDLPRLFEELIGDSITQEETDILLQRLIQTSIVGYKEARLLNEILQDAFTNDSGENSAVEEGNKHLRARVLRALLLFVCGRD